MVQEELYAARNHWYNLGLKLGLKSDVLDTIKIQCSEDPSNCFRDTLKDYLKTITPSWRALVEALKSPTVNQPQLAEKVEKNYCSAWQPGKHPFHIFSVVLINSPGLDLIQVDQGLIYCLCY